MQRFVDATDAFREIAERKAFLSGSPEVLALCSSIFEVNPLIDNQKLLAVRNSTDASQLAIARQELVGVLQVDYADQSGFVKAVAAFHIGALSYDSSNVELSTSWVNASVQLFEKEVARLEPLAFKTVYEQPMNWRSEPKSGEQQAVGGGAQIVGGGLMAIAVAMGGAAVAPLAIPGAILFGIGLFVAKPTEVQEPTRATKVVADRQAKEFYDQRVVMLNAVKQVQPKLIAG